MRERLLESGRYVEARGRYEALLTIYGWTTTGRYDVKAVIAELDALVAAPRPNATNADLAPTQAEPAPTQNDVATRPE